MLAFIVGLSLCLAACLPAGNCSHRFNGNCVILNLKLHTCEQFLGHLGNYAAFLTEYEEQQEASIASSLGVIDALIDRYVSIPGCRVYFKALICLVYLPPCNGTSNQPRPTCEPACESILYGKCGADYVAARQHFAGNQGFAISDVLNLRLPNCSTFPYSNSTEQCFDPYLLLPNTTQPPLGDAGAAKTDNTLFLIIGLASGSLLIIVIILLAVCFCFRVKRRRKGKMRMKFGRLHIIRARTTTANHMKENENYVESCSDSMGKVVGTKETGSGVTSPFLQSMNEKNGTLGPSSQFLVLPDRNYNEEMGSYLLELKALADSLESFLIKKDQVTVGEILGKGAFGQVQKGVLKTTKQTVEVAVKTIKNLSSMDSVVSFVRESSMMSEFSHPHILALCGVCLDMSDGLNPMILLPFMANGDLHSYLKKKRLEPQQGEEMTWQLLLGMCIQIADGMSYVTAHHFVHRDLAARNCMVDENLMVKVADFGLSRDIYDDDYYRMEGKGKLPVKWMAPESLHDRIYNAMTDVSYGVTAWEIFSLARTPYPGVSNFDIIEYIESERRLQRPENCPEEIYSVLEQCWNYYPDKRLSFNELKDQLSDLAASSADYLQL